MDKTDKSARLQYSTRVREDFPDSLALGAVDFAKKFSMRYGENPGYPAAFYAEAGPRDRTWPRWRSCRKGPGA